VVPLGRTGSRWRFRLPLMAGAARGRGRWHEAVDDLVTGPGRVTVGRRGRGVAMAAELLDSLALDRRPDSTTATATPRP
jgi:hypothetical protein